MYVVGLAGLEALSRLENTTLWALERWWYIAMPATPNEAEAANSTMNSMLLCALCLIHTIGYIH